MPPCIGLLAADQRLLPFVGHQRDVHDPAPLEPAGEEADAFDLARGAADIDLAKVGLADDGLAPEAIVRQGIAVVPEGARVFPEMTVLDNLRLGALVPRARARRAASLAEVLTLFPRLEERVLQPARTLSGGERQMLAIGRALMACPDLLLLDEPSLGLQPTLVKGIMETIRRINQRGITVFLIEQNVHFSLPMSHRAYVLEHGRIVLEGSGEALLRDPHVRVSYRGI